MINFMYKFLILFYSFIVINCHTNDDLVNYFNKECKLFEKSDIGLIYVYIPNRILDIIDQTQKKTDGIVFKTHHYYSLLALTNLFKPNKHNRMLFYYINDSGRPVSNHYNQWLNDTFWNSKIPIDSIKFVKLNYTYEIESNFDLYEIINMIKSDSIEKFDIPKNKYLLVTSDIIIGPKIQSCFTNDLTANLKLDINNLETIRLKTNIDCYNALNNLNDNYYSFLYHLDALHNRNDFSGIFLWNNRFDSKITSQMTSYFNLYKCNYRNEIFKESNYLYEDSYCVFGFELTAYEPPILQNIFQDNKYFPRLIRKIIYNNSNPVTYSMSPISKIPNIVHLIWFSTPHRSLKFVEYLSLKSILKVIKPDKVKIHGDNKPFECDLWKELSQDPRVEWVYRERPTFKYGQNFSNSPIQHLADVARLEVLYEEGGIYSDFDVLWVKPLDKFRFINVDLIASNDITSYCFEFPNNIQIGAFMAPAGSQFLKKWLNGYREKYHLFPGDYVAVSMCEPFKLYEKEPNNVYIDNRLQMIYFNGWSAFIPRYIDVEQHKLKEFNENLDFLNDGVHGYHLPRHGSLYTREDYDKSDKTSLPIKIATYILNL